MTSVSESAGLRVAITGGAGRLGSAVAARLLKAECRVKIIDREEPYTRTHYFAAEFAPAEFHRLDMQDSDALQEAFRTCDAIVHLAGLHGAHLAAGVSRTAFWRANVEGTASVVSAAETVGVERLVLASSTAVYGDGSPAPEPARVLDENTAVQPTDVYDLTKLAAERIVRVAARGGRMKAVCLRFGRFFFGSVHEYHLRKISTGLDLADAARAVELAVSRETPSDVYCVASDLDLTRAEREELGLDAAAVIRRHVPALEAELARRGWSLPARVGKSVDTTRIRVELGYAPTRDLKQWCERLLESAGQKPRLRETERRHAPNEAFASIFPPIEVAMSSPATGV